MNKLAPDEEEKLIARSQHGDVEAFNLLIEQYQHVMYSTVLRLLGDSDTAADVTQEAFISAFRAIRTYRGSASFRAWLLRIGSNLACDHWRRVQRHPTTSLDALANEDELHAASQLEMLAIIGPESNPEENILLKELQAVIQQGLVLLPLEQRTALVLCDIQGLSYEEAAQVMHTNLGTIRSRISRGRARLRTYLQTHRELLPRNYRHTNSTDVSDR
ncbi:sigma-70 family RNA polymerase sigma factor [Dictyobacter arantiisoli]|uniref:RNA polymerase subunit sigma-24 n=1 Tax=Dictyobacter arantiisoli TaxID=2014874 RepID=A0A5A5TGM0_9CHLR|nr:sigma-70 family RNA polymerase sigma factor [Dictyobacter arantiisoli]GCF10507.1 RNA polymerase subunit sigma-24 [Dictyobacter arantiisoli]